MHADALAKEKARPNMSQYYWRFGCPSTRVPNLWTVMTMGFYSSNRNGLNRNDGLMPTAGHGPVELRRHQRRRARTGSTALMEIRMCMSRVGERDEPIEATPGPRSHSIKVNTPFARSAQSVPLAGRRVTSQAAVSG
jgi:hypothetical protein